MTAGEIVFIVTGIFVLIYALIKGRNEEEVKDQGSECPDICEEDQEETGLHDFGVSLFVKACVNLEVNAKNEEEAFLKVKDVFLNEDIKTFADDMDFFEIYDSEIMQL